MSLLKRKQEREQKAAENAARLAKEKKRQELAIHPLVKGGRDRDIRDAYFQGIIFAAIADDDKIDKNEQAVLVNIGASLEMSAAEVEDGIACVTALTDDGKLSLIEECAKTIKEDDATVKLFYVQFIQLWTSHEYDKKELDEYLHQFADWTGVTLPEAKIFAIKKILEGDEAIDAYLVDLADWMGDDALKYFAVGKFGDVSEALVKERKRLKAVVEKKRREKADAEARVKAQQQLDEAIKDIVHTYGDRASITIEALEDVSERVSGIDGNLIDWTLYCNAILKRRNDVIYCHRLGACRRKIWRLVVLLMLDYKPKYSFMCDDLDWLLSSKGIECNCWYERLEGFMAKYLKDRVDIVDSAPEDIRTENTRKIKRKKKGDGLLGALLGVRSIRGVFDVFPKK